MELHIYLVCAILLFCGMGFSQEGGDRFSGLPFATRSPVLAQNGMAATSQPLGVAGGHRHPQAGRFGS